jgi:hypothetical protein
MWSPSPAKARSDHTEREGLWDLAVVSAPLTDIEDADLPGATRQGVDELREGEEAGVEMS